MKKILIYLFCFQFNLTFSNVFDEIRNSKLDYIISEVIRNPKNGYSADEVNGVVEALKLVKRLNLVNLPITALTLEILLEIHTTLMKNICQNAGKYRNVNIVIWDSPYKFPDASEVYKLMQEYIKWLHETKDFIIKFALDAHLKLVNIHPFLDGNGRLARIIMNIILIQSEYDPIIIDIHERDFYMGNIKKAQIDNNLVDYYNFLYQKLPKFI